MSVTEALAFFGNIPQIKRKLQTLYDVGLGYVSLGQPATTLSGGEAQRVKLAKELHRRQTGKTFYILDEPTTGLHFEDVRQLLDVLQRLVDAGNTVLVIEHNLDVIKVADRLIDMGPEGGNGGGTVVVSGTPEQVADCPQSYTGKFLAPLLRRDRERQAQLDAQLIGDSVYGRHRLLVIRWRLLCRSDVCSRIGHILNPCVRMRGKGYAMAKAVKTPKTNAMRELESAGISYVLHTYEDDGDESAGLGVAISEQLGEEPGQGFKTLVCVTPSNDHVVCCIPVADELDLKSAARAAGEKSLAMMHVKDLLAATGYVRGGCSPVGMKKRYRTLIDETCVLWDTIFISGGKRGYQLELAPDDLIAFCGATVAPITRED